MERDRTMSKHRTKANAAQADAPLEFHPLADLFPVMEGAEFDALVADIKAHGQQESIVTFEGKILDGRNRYRACLKVGLHPDDINFTVEDDSIDNPAAYVISKNIYRRHLTTEQRQALLMELVAAQPEKSDRQLAKETGTTHPTIAKARKQAEATGKALPVEKRTGADGKTRKQPKRGAKTNGKDQRPASEGNGIDPEASAAARKRQYGADDESPQPAAKTKPIGKREAERQAEDAKGEQAAKSLVAEQRDAARSLYAALRNNYSRAAFVEVLRNEFEEEFLEAEKTKAEKGKASATA
jgi:hypothetical protein